MTFNVTDKAYEEIINVIETRSNKDTVGVRVYIKGIGWGGPTFGVALDESTENDFIEELNGVKYFVEDQLLNQFKSFTIDYSNSFWSGKGFVVRAQYGGSSC